MKGWQNGRMEGFWHVIVPLAAGLGNWEKASLSAVLYPLGSSEAQNIPYTYTAIASPVLFLPACPLWMPLPGTISPGLQSYPVHLLLSLS